MARRRKKDELDPLQSLILLLVFGSFIGGYYLFKSLLISSIFAGAILGVYLTSVIILNRKNNERLRRSGITDIDKMDGRRFELYLGHLFEAQGYKAEVTQSSGDYGADLVISKNGKKIVVQAKRYSKNVGLKAVQEIHTALAHYKAAEAWVVTNSDYTEQAYNLAKSSGVKLINRKLLIEMILAINSEPQTLVAVALEEPVVPVYEPEEDVIEEPEDLDCPKCGYLLVKRKSSRGEFYGCSNFPKCRHTMNLNT
ncbi:restriction endonuclease [Paenibacillus sp. GSMTC-2017]|uniref:restriction endonuclease n=1 Tax=Paenibacillus sp. GSMTC-2017 TaxID=2794350 RepID=UPI0018D65FBE|nr:restriction endonuclease [Paenibacillus sp. GSMTC-2017]MBH5317779.1 restriction endonuclease [Paenibacillus sp. GSMTC-2017]